MAELKEEADRKIEDAEEEANVKIQDIKYKGDRAVKKQTKKFTNNIDDLEENAVSKIQDS